MGGTHYEVILLVNTTDKLDKAGRHVVPGRGEDLTSESRVRTLLIFGRMLGLSICSRN